jgi:hypothetical protein
VGASDAFGYLGRAVDDLTFEPRLADLKLGGWTRESTRQGGGRSVRRV